MITEERFEEMYKEYCHQAILKGTEVPERKNFRKALNENEPMHEYDWHYILHTGWAARILAETKPKVHLDFASSLYFVSIASAIVPKFISYDIRRVIIPLSGLETAQGDLTNLNIPTGSVESASCLHVLEHVGLGRYGDKIDPLGDQKAADELSRILAPGGQLLMVTPLGYPRICYNAHRIYSTEQLKKLFSGLYLERFDLITNDPFKLERVPNDFIVNDGTEWGACGCFRFIKQ